MPRITILLLLVSSSTSFTIPSRLAAHTRIAPYALKQSKDDHHFNPLAPNDTTDEEVVGYDESDQMELFFKEMEKEKHLAVAVDSTLVTSTAVSDKQEKDVQNARILLLGAAALYGTNFSFVKLLGEAMPVDAMGTLRFGLAALATLPWLLAKPREESDMTTTLAAALAGFEVGMWNSVGYVAQAVGLETTSAGKSAFLCSLAVVIVPLIDRCVGKQLTRKQVVGAAMAVLGVAFLELGGGPIEALSSGDIASLIQPVAFGIGFWKMEQAMRVHPDEASRSTAAQLFAIFCSSAAYMVAGGNVPDMTQVTNWLTDPMILGALVWTGAITTALTVYMETLALKTLSAADTTLIFSTEPLWGAAFASVVLGEHFGAPAIAGGALILAGCLVSNLGLNGMRDIVQSPQVTESAFGRKLMGTGVAGAIGGWVTSLSSGLQMAEASELDVIEAVEEVISKTTDML
jgi:drug/metabolite transporter (DMT)-like permease